MHDIPILSQLKEFKAIFLWKIFPYHRNFSPKLIKVPVLLFDTLEYYSILIALNNKISIFPIFSYHQTTTSLRKGVKS